MTEVEIIKLIRMVMRQELTQVLMGSLISNESETRVSVRRFSSESEIGNLRNILPFGLSSKATKGMDSIITSIGNNPTNLAVLGSFDKNRPTLENGEVILYNEFGELIYLSNGKIQIGSKESNEPLVLGNIFKQFAKDLIDLINNHTHVGNLGSPTGTPINAPDFALLKGSPIEDSMILSDKVFTEK